MQAKIQVLTWMSALSKARLLLNPTSGETEQKVPVVTFPPHCQSSGEGAVPAIATSLTLAARSGPANALTALSVHP